MKQEIKSLVILLIIGCVNNKEPVQMYKVLDSTLEKLMEEGNVEELKHKLSKTRDINEINRVGCTLLYMASYWGHKEVVKVLLAAGALPDKDRTDGKTPLYIASCWGHKEVVEVLLAAGAVQDKSTNNNQTTPLMIASKEGKIEVVKVLLRAGADKDKAMDDGRTSLFLASQEGEVEVVEELLAAGADKDKAMDDGYTPLYIASYLGYNEVVEMLLKAGAVQDNLFVQLHQKAPLIIAIQEGKVEVVEELLAAGADKDKAMNDGRTPIFLASQEGKVEVVEVLLAAGADKDKARAYRETPLYIASWKGHKEVVEALLEYGAQITDNCLEYARTEEIKQLLRNPPKQTKWPLQLQEERKQSKEVVVKEVNDLLLFDDPGSEPEKRCVGFVMKDKIGEGHYGEVFLGSYRNASGEEIECAVKIATSDKESALVQEGTIMRGLKHTNIINMLDMLEGPARLVLEYVPGGSLKGFLDNKRDNDNDLSGSMANNFAHQITSGMSYLSGKNIIHRDLSARNVLMKADGEGHLLKITDFGVSRDLPEEDEYYKAQSQTELPWRCLPVEALSDRQFTLKTDIWSYGVLLWEMMSLGRTPYEEYPTMLKVIRQLDRGKRLTLEDSWKERYSLFCNQTARCWEEEPSSRPSFHQLTEELEEEKEMGRVYEAIKEGDVNVIEEYLKAGNVNKVDTKGNTLLHHAVLNNQVEVVRLLMKSGANSNICNKNEKSSINLAKEVGNGKVKEILCLDIDTGADPEYL